MSDKFFFKGRIEKRENYENYGHKTKRTTKSGSEKFPLAITVASEERKAEIEKLLEENELFGVIAIDAEIEEDLTELNGLLNKPKTTTFEKTPNRNDPCVCGSGKKYKKCCG